MADVIEIDGVNKVKKDTEQILEDVAEVKVSADKAAKNEPFNFINSDITTIGEHFSDDQHIWYTVDLENCESIGTAAFEGMKSITLIKLPKALTISNSAFSNCTSLKDVYLPVLTDIGVNGFSGCKSLTELNLPLATNFGSSAFSECRALKKVNFPSAKSLSASLLHNCESLTDVNIPLATDLGQSCFYGCSSLKSVDLPSATKLGAYCFGLCTSLKTLIIRSESVCVADTQIFKDVVTPTIYVPDNLVSEYKSATNWSTYKNNIKPLSSYEEV